MLTIKKTLSKLGLRFKDHSEEKEFNEIKAPFVRDSFKYSLLILTVFLILYTVRYFTKHVSPQNYIFIGLIVCGAVLFLIRNRIHKYLEMLLFIYVVAIICTLASVYTEGIVSVASRNSFYIGYIFAMVHRLIGERVLKAKYVLLLYIVSISIKFPLVICPDGILIAITVILDVATVGLTYKSEKDERSLFDALYKIKRDLLKFKSLLTQYLPNQMAIFASDYSIAYEINNSFKKTFRTRDLEKAKKVLSKLVIEKETVMKYKHLFSSLGYNVEDENQLLTLSDLMEVLACNVDLLRDLGVISISVTETGVSADEYHEPLESNKEIDDSMLYERNTRVFKVKIFISPLPSNNTESIAMIFDDITQQRNITGLKMADRNSDSVIAMVSHEMRTPLNGMLGLIDIAKKNISEGKALFYLSTCRDSAKLLLNTVNSVLDMNQIKNNKLRLIYSPINVQDLLDEIKMLFNQVCRIKNLFLNVQIASNVPQVINSDKNRLTQILINLLGNAFKFTFRGGVTIKVDLESTNPCRVRFSVEDTGIGLNKEDQDKIFQAYGKLEQQNRKINTHGIGLGLTIANSLAMLLDSEKQKIQVKSEVDQGACFSFFIGSVDLDPIMNDTSIPDISSMEPVEDKGTTVFKKMGAYAGENYDNYSKMTAKPADEIILTVSDDPEREP